MRLYSVTGRLVNKNVSRYLINWDKKSRSKPRQKKKSVFREDTGVALASKSFILKKYKDRIGKRIKIEPYNSISGLIDIHTIQDLRLAKKIKNIL